VLWSLAVEEHFYLVWPLIVLVLSRRSLLLVSAAIFASMPLLRGIFAARGMNPDVIYMLSWFRFDGLAAGAMMAIWANSSLFSARSARRIAVFSIVFVTVLSVAGARYGINGTHTVASVSLRYTQTYLVFGALFVLVVAYRDTIWTAPLRWRFMQLTGALSYCLYLIHLSIGDGYEYLVRAYGIVPAERFGASGAVIVRTAVMVVASFVLAWFSRRYLEEPFLSLKERFTRRRPTAVAVEPSPELTGA
jgi:peptidoglycan/LPS O-acetylase OafA/YrhL